MPRIPLTQLATEEKISLLTLLEQIGKKNMKKDLYENLLYILPEELLQNKEFLSRYLLLAAVLDQHADSSSARETVVKIYETYGKDFFTKPQEYISKFDNIMNLVLQHYKPKVRVLRVKKEGAIIWRVGGYMISLINITKQYSSLTNYLKTFENPLQMLNNILHNPLIRGLLYEKAARMYIAWITHPQLYVNISDSTWTPDTIPMVINGHVCKVLARTGFLQSVLIESKDRPIVKAEEERNKIERLIKTLYHKGDYFAIDYGAFYIGLNYCSEKNPKCSNCPLNNTCKKNTQIRAY